MYSYNPYYYEYLAHHGVKGQKWGVRRYQPYTSANKGVFKNLKRSYKSSVRSLKKAKRQYESEGDKLAVKGTEKAIKEAKKIYKSELKGLKKDFRAENRANYLQDVAERGSEKQVAEVRKEMSPDQLDYAVRRINTYKNWEKLSMRDVEAEVKQEQAMKRLDHIMKGAETVSKVATSATQVIGTVKAFKDLFPKPKSEYEKEKQKLELEGMRNQNDYSKAQLEKLRAETKKVAGGENNNPTPPKSTSVIPSSSPSSNAVTGSYGGTRSSNVVDFKPRTITNATKNSSSNTISYSWPEKSKNTEVSKIEKTSLFGRIANNKAAQAAIKVNIKDIAFDFSADSKSGQTAASRYIEERNKGADRATASWKAEDSYAKSISNSKSPSSSSLLNYAKAKHLDDHETATMAVDKAFSKYFSEADRKAAQAYLDSEKKKKK